MTGAGVVSGVWKFTQHAGKSIGSAAITSKNWVVEHPGSTTGLVGCAAAAPLAIAAAPLVLGVAGFSASGVVAGGCYHVECVLLKSLDDTQVLLLRALRHPSGMSSSEALLPFFRVPELEERVSSSSILSLELLQLLQL